MDGEKGGMKHFGATIIEELLRMKSKWIKLYSGIDTRISSLGKKSVLYKIHHGLPNKMK